MFHNLSLKFKFTKLAKKFFVVRCQSFIAVFIRNPSFLFGLDMK